MSSKKRSHKTEKLARIYDDDVLPVWGQKFGDMVLAGLELPERGQILEVACGTGYVTSELLARLSGKTRIIAIESSSVMLDVARRKIAKMDTKGVFFRTASAEPRLSFADDVYDLVVSNLGLTEMDDVPRAVSDFARVTYPGGEVRCTLPLAGTFTEFFDIYREVLIKHDQHAALERLDAHVESYPTVAECERWMRGAFLGDARVEITSYKLLFRSSREFFFAPVIEYGPLSTWKNIAGTGKAMQDVFWYIKEAIDSYFSTRPFEITVRAACLIGTKREISEDDATGQVERIEPPAPTPYRPSQDGKTSTQLVVEALIESEEVLGPLPRNARGEGTAELDLAELVELVPEEDFDDGLGFVNAPDEPVLAAGLGASLSDELVEDDEFDPLKHLPHLEKN